MLKSKLLTIAISLSIIFLISNCSDTGVSPNNIESNKKLTKIISGSNDYTSFYYSNGKLSNFEKMYGSQVLNSSTLYYDSLGDLQSEIYHTQSLDYLYRYYYDSSFKRDSTDVSVIDSALSDGPFMRSKYCYNSINQLVKVEEYSIWKGNVNKKLSYTEYKYDDSGNVIEERTYIANVLSTIMTMAYDNKINPYRNMKDNIHFEQSLSKNNMTNLKVIYSDNTGNMEIKYTYYYDGFGYPIYKETEGVNSSNVKTVEERYEYQ